MLLQTGRQRSRERARAVVRAQAVVATARVRETVSVALGVHARADLHVQFRTVRDPPRENVDVATAERRGYLRRIALLDGKRLDDLRRKDVERNHVAREVGRRHLSTVQLDARIALAETPNVNELIVHEREPGNPPQSERDCAVADPRDGFSSQEIRDDLLLDPLLDHVERRDLLTADRNHFVDRFGGRRRRLLRGWLLRLLLTEGRRRESSRREYSQRANSLNHWVGHFSISSLVSTTRCGRPRCLQRGCPCSCVDRGYCSHQGVIPRLPTPIPYVQLRVQSVAAFCTAPM